MRILIALDENEYSTHALVQAAGLAVNTWADVILLAVFPQKITSLELNHVQIVDTHLNRFLDAFNPSFLPYQPGEAEGSLKEIEPGIFEKSYADNTRNKELNIRIRGGDAAHIILDEAAKEGCDLIILGCEAEKSCRWIGGENVPYKVSMEARCSVLVVKKETDTQRVLSCLDHDHISQESLEMITQMSTLFSADLDIVGLTKKENLKKTVQRKLDGLLTYYISKKIQPWIELVDISVFDRFISQKKRWSLIAMWMGKKSSIFEQLFPSSKVSKLLQKSESSVLMLR